MEILARRSARLIFCLGIAAPIAGSYVSAAARPSSSSGWTMAAMPAKKGSTQGSTFNYNRKNGPATWLLTTRQGLVALIVAYDGCCPPHLHAQEWISRDGRTWQQIALAPSIFGQKKISAVAAGPSGLVAVGSSSGAAPGSPSQPAAWFSPDGRSWQQGTGIGAAFSNGEMLAVTATDSGFVAVGDAASPGDELSPPSNLMAVWLSADGRRWQLVSDTSPVFQNATAEVIVQGKSSMTVIGESRAAQGFAPPLTVVWTSRDGRSWQRMLQAAGVFPTGQGILLQGVIAGYRREIAWGVSLRSVPLQIVWTSKDGAHWSKAPGIHFQYGLAGSIIPHGHGFIALGTRDDEPALWSSPDGIHWAPAAGEDVFGGGGTQLGDAVDWQGGIVVVGTANRPAPITPFYTGPSGSQVFSPTAWLWRPGTRGQRHPEWPRTDPKWFRLRIADLPSGFQLPALGINGYYIGCSYTPGTSPPDACTKALSALGSNVTFSSRFPYGGMAYSDWQNAPYVGSFAILTRSPAKAKAAFQYAAGLVHAVDLNLNQAPARPIRALHIGQGAELFSQKITSPCPAAVPQCPPFAQGGTAYAVVWWDGRALGVVEVVGVPLDREALAITLAQRQWTHRHALGF